MNTSDLLFRVGRPLLPPQTFDNPNLRGLAVLQQALRIRKCDYDAWVLMAWWKNFKVPHYLTPDGDMWTNGLDGQQWLHESFAVFPTREQAKAVGEARRWGKSWVLLQLAQVQVRDDVVFLVPAYENDAPST